MLKIKYFTLIFILLSSIQLTRAQDTTDAAGLEPLRLFSCDSLLEFELVYDFDELQNDRGKKRIEHDALLYLRQPADTFEVELKARGGFRRDPDNCHYPPLRLDFVLDDVKGTYFEGVNKIKLYTQCRRDTAFVPILIREYLAYRVYAVLSDYHFKVRPARVTLRDEHEADRFDRIMAFFLEPDEEVERRMEGRFLDIHHIDEFMLSEFETNCVAMFEYMIGNSDWLLYNMHNVDLLSLKLHQPLPVPNDFDGSGMVDAPYAEPAPDTQLKNVRERYFRGAPMKAEEFARVRQLFMNKKEDMYAVIRNCVLLGDQHKVDIIRYLDGFYVLLNDEGHQQEVFLRNEQE